VDVVEGAGHKAKRWVLQCINGVGSYPVEGRTKLARNVHWIVLYQICVFGADLKSNMTARVHNVFSLAEILKIFLSETTKSIEL
jgi:hypothetical protein